MIKRFLSMLSAVILLFSLFSCGRIIIIDWNINNGVLTVSGASTVEYGTYPWSNQRDDFSEIVIKQGVMGIGEKAFFDCDKVKKVTVPSTVKFIGSKAFADCDRLEEVILSAEIGTVTIADDAFDDSSVIRWRQPETTAKVSDSESVETEPAQVVVTEVPEPTEYNTTWIHRDGTLTISGSGSMDEFSHIQGSYLYDTPWQRADLDFYEVIFGSFVTHITEGAFFRAFSLEKVEIPSNVVYIGKEAFDDCFNLTSLTLNEGLLYIDDYAFGSIGIETLIIPSSVYHIGCSAFDYCPNLKHVIIENKEGALEIGEFAFPQDCKVTYTG